MCVVLVSTDHILPRLTLKQAPVEVSECQHIRSRLPLYSASFDGLGCSGACATPQQAIALLFGRHGCQVIEVLEG